MLKMNRVEQNNRLIRMARIIFMAEKKCVESKEKGYARME